MDEGIVALARAKLELAQRVWRLGRFEDAVVAARSAVLLWEATGEPEECEALCTLSIACTELGLFREALAAATSAFEKANSGAWIPQRALALSRIGICHDRLGDAQQAENFFLHALELAHEVDDRDLILSIHNSLMAVGISSFYAISDQEGEAVALAKVERFRRYADDTIAQAMQVGDSFRQAVCMGNAGEMLGLLRSFDKALVLLQASIDTARQFGYRGTEFRSRFNAAEVRLRNAAVAPAVAELERLVQEMTPSDQESTTLRIHSALHRAYKSVGQFEKALAHAETSHRLEMCRSTARAAAQDRLMVNRVEMELLRIEGERARSQTRSALHRSSELEAEKLVLQQKAAELRSETLQDALTGLGNRRLVDEQLPDMLRGAAAAGACVCVALCDLDLFKTINDRFGHSVGDVVLRDCAAIFRSKVRSQDLLARIGGEEFLFVFNGTALDVANDVCERLRVAVAEHDWSGLRTGLSVSVSIGLYEVAEGIDKDESIRQADMALYDAKRGGRNSVVVR